MRQLPNSALSPSDCPVSQIDSTQKPIGNVKLSDPHIAVVNQFMTEMAANGYAPKSVAGCFRLLKQALKRAVAQAAIAWR